MNREIKFRVWCKGTSTNANFNKPRWILPTDFILLKYYRCFQDVFESDDFVVQQYTGLKDKNGKEIHEGDIVKAGAIKGLINFSEGAFFVGDVLLILLAGDLRVVGNIFENPELIKTNE